MAHETSNPKVRVMFLLAIVSAVGLAIFDQIFRSYYNSMMEEEESEKVLTVPTKQLNALRTAEQQRLTSSAFPIDRAMQALATKGREDPSLKDMSKVDITPEASNDVGAVTGWGQLATPGAAPVATPSPAPSAPFLLGDGGPTLSSDAGAMPALADGGNSMRAPLTVDAGPAAPPAPVPAPLQPPKTPDAGTH